MVTVGASSFGRVGRYEKVRGSFAGSVDPANARNASIADLESAPLNEDNLVQHEVQFVLLRTEYASKGNHGVVYEPINRGSMLSLFFLNRAPPPNDPSSRADAGNGFLMRQGYSFCRSRGTRTG